MRSKLCSHPSGFRASGGDQRRGRLSQPSSPCQPRYYHAVHAGRGTGRRRHRDDSHPRGGEPAIFPTRTQLQQAGHP